MNVQDPINFNSILSADGGDFTSAALTLFRFQYQNNAIYRAYCDLTRCDPASISSIEAIPFLPIGFFKNKEIKTTGFVHEVLFESSKTTGADASKHFLKDVSLYRKSFRRTFEMFYGDVHQYCIIGLLPSYLERVNSSLVYMVDDLIKGSGNRNSGFYLHDFAKLLETLRSNEAAGQPTLLIGVTFALLDFASEYPLPLSHTTVIETGGMKGRKRELTRAEVHDELKDKFQTRHIHSEYGMTELLSQAYATEDGIFKSPPWMKMLARDVDDPFKVHASREGKKPVNGLGNVIDLANVYSCSFIATDDVVRIHPGDKFEILGRADNSDVRGCSLMVNAL